MESDFSDSRDSSFVELLSAADRPKFLDFVSVSASSGATSPSSFPRGLRVTLCGSSGDTGRRGRSLSVDLFHVALPGYHLLAIKEDPESGSLLEEAPSSQPLILPAIRVRSEAPSGRSSRASTASSRNEAWLELGGTRGKKRIKGWLRGLLYSVITCNYSLCTCNIWVADCWQPRTSKNHLFWVFWVAFQEPNSWSAMISNHQTDRNAWGSGGHLSGVGRGDPAGQHSIWGTGNIWLVHPQNLLFFSNK